MCILTYDEAHALLDEITDSFPPAFFAQLNGAVLLLPELRNHPGESELFTLGMYCCDALGRRIELYYGSFAQLAKEEDWTERDWKQELRDTLSHEFTHHIESLAGERGLEIKDAEYMQNYYAEKKPKKYRLVKKPPHNEG